MATRFYFPASEAAAITPSFDAGWNYNSEALRRRLAKPKGSSAIATGTQIGPWTAAQTPEHKALDRQYISDPIVGGTISGTCKGQLMVREYATGDNVGTTNLKVWVVKPDGTSRGTLLAIGAYGTALEFISNATHRNAILANGDALSSVVAVDGDRIVVEIGYNGTSTATPEASAKWGENATDLPENQTQTTDGAGWFEFSGTITVLHQGAGAVAGSSTVSGAGITLKYGAGAATGAATAAADGTVVEAGVFGEGATSGAAVAASIGITVKFGGGSVSGASTVAGAGIRVKLGAGQASGAATVAGAGLRIILASGAIAGVATVTAAGVRVKLAAAAVEGVASATAAGVRLILGTGATGGTADIQGAGLVAKLASGQADGAANVQGAGFLLKLGATLSVGAATAAADGFVEGGDPVVWGSGSASGIGSASGSGLRDAVGSGSISGSSGATAIGIIESPPAPPEAIQTITLPAGARYTLDPVAGVFKRVRPLRYQEYAYRVELATESASLVSLRGATVTVSSGGVFLFARLVRRTAVIVRATIPRRQAGQRQRIYMHVERPGQAKLTVLIGEMP